MTDTKFNINKIDGRLSAIYSTDKDKEATYNQWAATYESDLVNDLDYVAHVDSAKIFHSLKIPTTARILDVACGTGLVGEQLRQYGYSNVDGTDFSSEMLKLSASRNVYLNLFRYDCMEPAKDQGVYDALICVGLFSFNGPKICHMINVINLVKPASYCVITVNGAAWNEKNLGLDLENEARIHRFSVEQNIHAGYINKEGIDARVLIIKRPE